MCDKKRREVFILSPNLRELLEDGILIGDGAVGTLLGERGVGFGHPYARANLSHPEMVTDIHEEYLRAGADVIETNTFAANRFKLETHDLEERVREVNAGAPGSPAGRPVRAGTGDTGARARGHRSARTSARPRWSSESGRRRGPYFWSRPKRSSKAGRTRSLLETFTDLSSCGSPTRRSRLLERRCSRTRPSSRTARR